MYVADGRAWAGRWQALGQLGDDIPPGGVIDQPCPPGWPEGVPCVLPSELPPFGQPPSHLPPGRTPGIPQIPGRTPGRLPPGLPSVTEEEAREREAAAAERARSEERSSLILYTAIGSVVSGVVGIALGRILHVSPVYKFDSCPPGICPRGMRVVQLGDLETSGNGGPLVPVTLLNVAAVALGGAITGSVAGAVAAGKGKRGHGALIGSGVGAAVHVMALIVQAAFR